MDLKTFAEEIAKIGLPLLGAALPLPGGEAIGAAIASQIGTNEKPEAILAKLQGDPDALLKMQKFEIDNAMQLKLIAERAQADADAADAAQVASVNTTMQAEATNSASENWWQTGWRPFNGYVVGLTSFLATMFVCFLFYKALTAPNAQGGLTLPAVLAVIPQLAQSVAMLLAIPGAAVGITAWHRGMLQREQAGGDDAPDPAPVEKPNVLVRAVKSLKG